MPDGSAPVFEIRLTREAVKDAGKLSPKLKEKLRQILMHRIAVEPHAGKRLVGDLTGFYSWRLSFHDRIVYTIEGRTVFVHRARTHYGD